MKEQAAEPVEAGTRSDADVFAAIRGGDVTWRELFFRRHERMVRHLIARRLGTRQGVDDLVSEAFLRFFERAAHVRSAHALKSYLYTIALHTARYHIRRCSRERRVLTTCAPELMDEMSSAVDPGAHAALRQLEGILRGMRGEEREAYVLRQVVGLDLPQIASALGVSLSTARRRLCSAREVVEKRAARNALLSEYVSRASVASGHGLRKRPRSEARARVA